MSHLLNELGWVSDVRFAKARKTKRELLSDKLTLLIS